MTRFFKSDIMVISRTIRQGGTENHGRGGALTVYDWALRLLEVRRSQERGFDIAEGAYISLLIHFRYFGAHTK